MKRLGFTKSRNGCQRCKQRRVKCDEKAPCVACARHGLACSLTLSSSKSKPRNNASKSLPVCFNVAQVDSPSPVHNSASPSASMTYSQPSSSTHDSPSPRFQRIFRSFEPVGGTKNDVGLDFVSDLELMHHYTAKAYCTLSSSPGVSEALQYDIPRQAFSEPSLLHQLHAFSALHLAYLNPDHRQQYLIRAYQHQDKAFEQIKSVLDTELTQDNCHGIYAASIFLIICAFATLPSSEIFNIYFNAIDTLGEVFTLISGMAVILISSDKELRTGPLKGIFDKPSSHTQSIIHLQELSQQLVQARGKLSDPLSNLYDSNSLYTADAATILIEAIAKGSRNTSIASAELRTVFVWPLGLTQSYLELVQRRHPSALVILAYYCVVLFHAEESCWFLQQWAGSLMLGIREQLLGTPYYDMLEWPMSILH